MTEGENARLPEGFSERVSQVGGALLAPGLDDTPNARIPSGKLIEFMESLKEGPGLAFEMLTDVCSVDEYDEDPRFDVIYHLRSLKTGEMVRIKVHAEGDPPSVPSVVPVYSTADWHEREVYDMMGITFEGHPDLKRILMPLEYEWYPLRKDFPLEGVAPEKLYKRQYPD
ncbi:MAG: NADH-quinone oxidoreductase subunit C [Planctomycetota bacterium]|jgi:NADH-quinone oxidoreductase subunit C